MVCKGRIAKIFFCLAALCTNSMAVADDDLIQIIQPESKSQVWVNPGMVSYHFQTNQNLNGGNWGAGVDYRFNTVASLTARRFYNSDRSHSNYAGMYY